MISIEKMSNKNNFSEKNEKNSTLFEKNYENKKFQLIDLKKDEIVNKKFDR